METDLLLLLLKYVYVFVFGDLSCYFNVLLYQEMFNNLNDEYLALSFTLF